MEHHEVKILRGDDWIQVFVDGDCIHEGHSFVGCHIGSLLDALNVYYEEPEGEFCRMCGKWHHDIGEDEECSDCEAYNRQ